MDGHHSQARRVARMVDQFDGAGGRSKKNAFAAPTPPG